MTELADCFTFLSWLVSQTVNEFTFGAQLYFNKHLIILKAYNLEGALHVLIDSKADSMNVRYIWHLTTTSTLTFFDKFFDLLLVLLKFGDISL